MQVIVNANVINLAVLLNIQIFQIVSVEIIIDTVNEECTKTIEEVKLVNITIENENSYYKCGFYNVHIA